MWSGGLKIMSHRITVTDRTPLKDEQQWLLSPRAAAKHIMWWNRPRPCLSKIDNTTFSDCLSLICRNIIPIILKRRQLPVSVTFTPATPFIHPTSVSLAPHFSSYTVALKASDKEASLNTPRTHTHWTENHEVKLERPPAVCWDTLQCTAKGEAIHCGNSLTANE